MRSTKALLVCCSALLLTVATPVLAGGTCHDDHSTTVRIDQTTTYLDAAVRDENNSPLIPIEFGGDPTIPLYSVDVLAPVIAPADGHQVTLGEWSAATGRASLKCIHNGTHVDLQMHDLIPGGLYDLWLFAQPFSGFDDRAFGLLTPEGASFVASRHGHAHFNGTVEAGPLSVRGTVGDCLLDDQIVFIIVLFHNDGQLYGGQPGPSGYSLDHFNWNYNHP
jgi:hypothetical protein